MIVVNSLYSITTDHRIRDKQHGYKQVNEANFDKIALIMGTFKAMRSGSIDLSLTSNYLVLKFAVETLSQEFYFYW